MSRNAWEIESRAKRIGIRKLEDSLIDEARKRRLEKLDYLEKLCA